MADWEFSDEVAREILDRLVDEPLSRICLDAHMPNRRAIGRRRERDPEFDAAYHRAQNESAHPIVDDILEISDRMLLKPSEEGYVEPQAGRAAIDAKKWIAAHRNRAYTDRVDLNHSGAIQAIPDEQLSARITQLLGKTGAAHATGGTGPQDPAQSAGDLPAVPETG